MATFRFAVDFDSVGKYWSDLDSVKKRGAGSFFETVLTAGLASLYKEGVSNVVARQMSRLMAKVDVSKDGMVEVSEGDVDFLKKLFEADNTRWPHNHSRVVASMQDALDDTLSAIKAGKEKKA